MAEVISSQELPSPVSSDEALPSPAPSQPELDDGPGDSDKELCCRAGCQNAITESPALLRLIQDIQTGMQSGTKAQREQLQFSCLRQWGGSGENRGWRKYIWRIPLCQKAVCWALNLSDYKRKEFNKQISEGYLLPKRCLKATQCQRDKTGQAQADLLLSWLHSNVAEHLPESHDVRGQVATNESNAQKKLLQAGKAAVQERRLPHHETIPYLDEMDQSQSEVRWLPPETSVAEMRDLALTFLPHCQVSYNTFLAQYHSKWDHKLKTRTEGQHAPCTACARFNAPEDVALVSREYSAHLEAVMQGRQGTEPAGLASALGVARAWWSLRIRCYP